ncbi:MAG: ATP-binding cassette domain-containing protein [Hyphomicrobiaceae bacterium]
MAAPLLSLRDIHLTFGGTPLLTGADLLVAENDRICLVGRNGSGKSTLMKIAAGLVESDRGERVLRQGTSLRYLPQEPDLAGFATTLAYVEAGLGPADDRHQARRHLEALGLSGDEEPQRLSGGEVRRVALARALAPAPDVLLLDEPTNHLDLPAIEWLESELASRRGAVVLISHDRRFLQRLTRTTIWIDRGLTRRLSRGFGEFEAWRDDLLAREAEEAHKLERKIASEMDWLYYGGITARRRRNQGRVAALEGMRQQRREARAVQGRARMVVSESETSGRLVIEAEGISKQFGDRPIVADLSLKVLRGDRLGIVGANGAGKTTLLTLLTGQLAPDRGTLKLGTRLEIVTLDQTRESLDPEASLAETLTGGRGDTVRVGGQSRHVASYMKDFLFLPEQARSPVKVLSGGERARLMLACAFARPSNVLVIDEPTNDLDLETLDLLQELLADYQGTVLLVSHDRDFLDRIVTSVLAAEGEGRWQEYAGGYSDMQAQRAGNAPEPAAARRKEAAQGGASSEAGAGSGVTSPAKLSFKEKRALDLLPERMAALEAEIDTLKGRLADTSLYARDPAAFKSAAARLEACSAELATAEEEWLALEIKREELATRK